MLPRLFVSFPNPLWLCLSLLLFIGAYSQVSTATDDQEPEAQLTFDPALSTEIQNHLKKTSYRFCQDPTYRLFDAEKTAYCTELPAFGERCPGLKAACERPSWEDDYEPPETDFWDWLDFDWSWLGIVLKAIFWTTLAAGVFFLLRALKSRLQGFSLPQRKETVAAVETAETREDKLELLPVVRLLELSAAAFAAGQVHEALHLSYRATIRQLGALGWVKPHRSLTSGDYLRTLRKRRQLTPIDESEEGNEAFTAKMNSAYQAHLGDLDRARFGSTPNQETTQSLLERTRAFISKSGPALALLCAFGLGACEPRGNPEPPFARNAPRGYQLFFDLLDERVDSISWRLHPISDFTEDTYTIVAITPHLKAEEWTQLQSWTEAGGHFVIVSPPDIFSQTFDLAIGTKPCFSELSAPELNLKSFETLRAFEEAPPGEALAECADKTFAYSLPYGEGWLTVAADTRFFESASLAAVQNSALALYIVGDLEGHLEFIGPWTGSGATSPIESLVKAGFDFWLIHMLFLGGLYLWAQGRRPGTPIEVREEKRRSFIDHAKALSRRYQQGKASGWVLERYAEFGLELLRRRVPSGRSDLRSVCRSVSSNERSAAALREALITGRKASELGGDERSHLSTFKTIQNALQNTTKQRAEPEEAPAPNSKRHKD